MTTLRDTMLPESQQLRNFLNAECPGKSDEDIVKDFTAGLAKLLATSPRMYRSYGPYWPAIKQQIILNVSDPQVGRNIDVDVLSIYSYESAALTCAAAILYQDDRIHKGLQYSTRHDLPVDGYDTYEFDYSDQEMEIKVLYQ